MVEEKISSRQKRNGDKTGKVWLSVDHGRPCVSSGEERFCLQAMQSGKGLNQEAPSRDPGFLLDHSGGKVRSSEPHHRMGTGKCWTRGVSGAPPPTL